MTATFNASTSGLAQTSDLSGALQFQTANTTAVIIGTNQSINCTSTTATIIPSSTTANRPASPSVGMMRYNTTLAAIEIYGANGWAAIT